MARVGSRKLTVEFLDPALINDGGMPRPQYREQAGRDIAGRDRQQIALRHRLDIVVARWHDLLHPTRPDYTLRLNIL